MAVLLDTEVSPNWALFLNCLENETPYENILQELTQDQSCNEGHTYKWPINNKYYSTDIFIHTVHAPLKESSGHTPLKEVTLTSHKYQAVVMFVEISSNSAEVICAWWSSLCDRLEEMPDVCVLVAMFGRHDHHLLQELLHWSIREGVELIECEGKSEEEVEGEGDEREQSGVERLSEVLQAHMWPVMTLHSSSSTAAGQEEGLGLSSQPLKHADKDSPISSNGSVPITSEPCSTAGLTSEPLATATSTSEPCVTTALTSGPCVTSCEERATDYSSVEEKLLAEGLDSSKDPGGETFEQLFSRFAAMKEHAESLPHEERKIFAEKVVLAFWDAVGGDEDEVRETDTNEDTNTPTT